MNSSSYDESKNKLIFFGIKLLTEKENFNGTNVISFLECSNGHQWNAKISHILQKDRINRPSKGCPECASNFKLDFSKNHALKNLFPNHEIISTYLKTTGTKIIRNDRYYEVKCDKGHIYHKNSGTLSQGCPQCSKKTFVGQERVRLMFQAHFQKAFPTVRPDWLKNPLTNKNLELDGYCQELKVAFEYQGRQHSSNDTEFGGDYEAQAIRDQYKVQACIDAGVQLYVISQPRSYEAQKFIHCVQRDCTKQGLLLDKLESLDFTAINDTNTLQNNYEKFKDYCTSKGYRLLSSGFATMEDQLEFSCIEGHLFSTKGSIFKTMLDTTKYRNEPCIHCHSKDNTVKENLSLISCQNFSKSIGYQCISSEYKNINSPLNWICNGGHQLVKSFRQMKRNKTGKYCPQCNGAVPVPVFKEAKNSETYNYQWLQNLSKDKGLVLLEKDYFGMDYKHSFTCQNGHNFLSSVAGILKNKVSCQQCKGVIDIDTAKEFANTNSLILISKEYKNVNSHLEWICKSGHHFSKTYRQMQRNKTAKYCPNC